MTHTPGPWGIYIGRRIIRVRADDYSIAQILRDTDGPARDDKLAIANARLIAAAPAMLAACQSWIAWAEQPVIEHEDGHIELPSVTAVLARTRAAIAQVER